MLNEEKTTILNLLHKELETLNERIKQVKTAIAMVSELTAVQRVLPASSVIKPVEVSKVDGALKYTIKNNGADSGLSAPRGRKSGRNVLKRGEFKQLMTDALLESPRPMRSLEIAKYVCRAVPSAKRIRVSNLQSRVILLARKRPDEYKLTRDLHRGNDSSPQYFVSLASSQAPKADARPQ